MRDEDSLVYGRRSVMEALKADVSIERLYVAQDVFDSKISSIIREAKKRRIEIQYVPMLRLDQMTSEGVHQGVLCFTSPITYVSPEQILEIAQDKNESPFVVLLDGISDPHNLGAIIRTAHQVGAHGVIIPKHRAAGVTATVVKASAGAVFKTAIARVTNLKQTMTQLKNEGLWFVCAAMDGEPMYHLDLKGPIGLVIGNEGSGVSKSVKEECDFSASIPMKGSIDSLNASVACGVLSYEILRQREYS